MEGLVRPGHATKVRVVGFNIPLKDLLGVGANIGDETPEMAALLEGKENELKRRIFNADKPAPEEIVKAIESGKILDFRDTYAQREHSGYYQHTDDFDEDFRGYMHKLAYHYYIKRDVLRIASDSGIVISPNPLSDTIRYPIETVMAPQDGGRRAVEGFIERLRRHMRGSYGVGLRPLDETPNAQARARIWTETAEPSGNLVYPDDWERNLREQRPPETDDIREVREFFNRWYMVQPYMKRKILDEMLKGPTTSKFVFGGIPATVSETAEQRVRQLNRPRI